jgi:AAA domain
VFHAIVGHYVGCGWDADRIYEHLQQYPQGIGERYLHEDRLRQEIERSAGKFAKAEPELPKGSGDWTSGFETKAPPEPEQTTPPWEDEPQPAPKEDDPEHDLGHEQEQDEDLDGDDDLGEEPPKQDPNLPQLYAHGDPDPRPLKSWLIEDLIPEVGHGLISGQWGAGKTAIFLDLARAVMTGQPFINYTVARQCGVLLIAVEGQHEVRARLDALAREKCGGMPRMPFRWYEAAPPLLQKDAAKTLIAMARQAETTLDGEFGLPLGLIGIDTLTVSAGYGRSGDEQDNAVGQAAMNVLKAIARELKCFVFPLDHFGKTPAAGTRGASAKEASADVVLACLGEKQLDGSVTNSRLAVRKNRSGPQGRVHPFTLRTVELSQLRRDGKPETTVVVDWSPPGSTTQAPPPPDDPWAKPKRQDQRTAMLRLKRVLMAILAEQGVDQPIAPEGPMVRMVDQKLVRKAFYAHTPADGTPEQKRKARHMQFTRAVDWAEEKRLIGIEEIKDVTYLRLSCPDPGDEEEEQD